MTVAFLLGLVLAQAPARSDRPPDLPQLKFANFLPAVREQIEKVSAAAHAHPTNAEASGQLGMVLDAYEQHDAAETCYRRAHLLDAKSFRWLYYLGSVQAAQGRHEDAAASLRGALALKPDDVPAQLRLAESLLTAGQLDEAGRAAELVVHAQAGNAEAHYHLGRVAAARSDLTTAVVEFSKACDLFPSYGAAHYALAMAYRTLGRTEDARQHFALYEQHKGTVPPLDDPLRREVTALNLGSVAHIRRAADLDRAGRTGEAIAETLEALRVDPRSVQAEINLVSLYGRLGRYQEATAHYEAAVAIDPNQADLHYNYGVLLLKQGRIGDAEAAFQEAVRINPSYVEAHNNLGTVFEQQGRLDAALREFAAVVESRPGDRAAHFRIGRILANQQKYNLAIQHFLKTLTPEDDNTPRYRYALGATYARAADNANAIKYLREARTGAAARGQEQLVSSIDRDLKSLETAGAHTP
jgi:tetratricopeptide (TPR) repeat protein